MKERYNETFNKVKMNESRKDEIKNMIRDESTMKQSPIKRYYILAAAVIIASIFVIPPTRNMAMAAARYIKNKLSLRSGIEIEYTNETEGGTINNKGKISNSTSVSITQNVGDNINKYTRSENGKLLFLDGDKTIDITDKCSEDDYYKYSYNLDNENKAVVYVGGTAESSGWIEYAFDNTGKCVSKTKFGNVDGTTWAEKADKDSGVKNQSSDGLFIEVDLNEAN
ncbi:MAG: hypothetical protein J6M65_03905 [Eubacterium sp.]|nr:hypothetical protein [Eubacterium sp.]